MSSNKMKVATRITILSSLLFILLSFFLYRQLPDLMTQNALVIMLYISYVYLGALSIAIALFILWWPAEALLIFMLNKKSNKFSPQRRRFLQHSFNAAIMSLTAGSTILGITNVKNGPILKKVKLKLPKINLDTPLSFIQISDLHIAPTIEQSFLTKVVEKINSLNVDFVAVTGDLVDGSIEAIGKKVDPLKDLKSKHGTFFVTGNHEYYSGVHAWVSYLKLLGIKVLDNQAQVISHLDHSFLLAGVPDIRMEKSASSPAAAMGDFAPLVDYKILLAHQPRSCYAAFDAGFDLMVCGHTHGGQYWPMTDLIEYFQPFVKGFGKYKDLTVYVNSGTGQWGPPMRLGTQAEITLFEIS
ncbi:MAG: metallophosphoesterase [Bacteriovoracaceae bacterium]|nr:metallophosphoesterase [Bacteriovoracaceae bacterium]